MSRLAFFSLLLAATPVSAQDAGPDAASTQALAPEAGMDAASADGGADAASPADAGVDGSGASDAGPGSATRAGSPAAGGQPSTGAHAEEIATGEEARFIVIKTVVGLAALMTLVWLGAHPRVRRLEELLGIRQAITAGFAFVALGFVARLPSVGVLSDEVLSDLTPVLHFALGWIGLVIGFQFDVRALDRLPRGIALDVALRTITPFIAVGAAGAVAMLLLGHRWQDATFARDAVVLATAGAIAAGHLRGRSAPAGIATAVDPVRLAASLDEIAAIAGLSLLGALFRPPGVAFEWELPGTVWMLLTLGVGTALGLLGYAIVAGRSGGSEFLALSLGTVAFGAGLAGYLYLSPLVVCFLAGALLVNLPGDHRGELWKILSRLERPIEYLLLMVAGALWDVTDYHGWILMGVFIGARIAGNLLLRVVRKGAAERGIMPHISVVSIAIVVSAQALYQGRAVPWLVTAVLGGAIVSEILGRRREDPG